MKINIENNTHINKYVNKLKIHKLIYLINVNY